MKILSEIPTRRDLLALSIGASALLINSPQAFSLASFWEKKAADEWTTQEVEVLTTNSPWARKVPLEFGGGRAQAMDSNGSSGTFGGMRGADSNGISETRGRGARGGGGGGGETAKTPEVTVRWESARPMMDATKWTPPPAFANNYGVSVTNLPPAVLRLGVADHGDQTDPAERQRASIQRLLSGTTLIAKGRESKAAAFVVQSTDHTSLIFGFDKTSYPVSLDDKEITFAMELGRFKLHAKFEPKRMTYHGQLAI